MKKVFSIIVFGVVLLFSGCLNNSSENDQYVVRVNDYKINKSDIDTLFKFEVEMDSNFHISEATKVDFIMNLVHTQLLIQEAKKRKLDQRESFRQTIQRYWESTLIRDLLAEKGKQLRETTTVTKEEVEEYYRKNKALFKDRPLKELRVDLSNLLEDQKVTAELKRWSEELESEANIEINDVELAVKIQRKSN